jgi:dipeptidyl aminopeptidase/acylaminoacyl peptidase
MATPVFSLDVQCLTAAGYAVILVNPRASFGYGQDIAKGCLGDVGGRDYDDLMAAVDEAIGRFDFVDSSRLGVMGGSYGGLLTNWIIGHTDRFRVAVAERCISNWISFYGTSDIGARYTESEIGANPWIDPERMWDRSPLAYAPRMDTPLLLLHGERDMRCPMQESEQLHAALKQFGKPVEFVWYKDIGHSMHKTGRPALRVDRLTRILRWLEAHLDSTP